jgi:SAM-dependent methyltransferase
MNPRVLDAGCGRQPFRESLEHSGYSYCSLDSQQNCDGSVDYISPIDEPLPQELLHKGPFALVVCTEVLEHVARWDIAFGNFAELLDSGGRLLITCPHFYQLHEEPYDFWRPTLHALRYFAAEAGLRVVHEEAAGDGWDVLGTLIANCRPAVRSDSWIGRAVSKVLVVLKKGVFRLLRYRLPQRLIELQGPLYLSNVVVLEKP